LGALSRFFQRFLPKNARPFAAGIYWLGSKHQCPICRWPARAFRPLSVNPDFPERCSRCGSLARHRLLWLFFQRRTNLFQAPLEVLHFSPEACFTGKFSRLKNLKYTTADVEGGYTSWMETLDVTAIAKPDETYDAVICLHVLQAVEEDHKAMRELFRVLKPGGWAILNSRLDIYAERTRPNPALPPLEVRAQSSNRDFAFRIYGRDFADQLREAGFEVEIVPFGKSLTSEEIDRYYLHVPGDVYLCRRPSAS
jgi:SAM-dependent methyltransferase